MGPASVQAWGQLEMTAEEGRASGEGARKCTSRGHVEGGEGLGRKQYRSERGETLSAWRVRVRALDRVRGEEGGQADSRTSQGYYNMSKMVDGYMGDVNNCIRPVC